MGQFFGNVAERWAADSIVVNRLVHDQPRALPSHAHVAGFVSLMLRGEYRETAGFQQFGYQPFSCIYHPPGMEHRDVIGRAGVTLLTLEFRPELFDGMDAGGINLRPIIDLSGKRPAWNLMGLYRQIVALRTNQLDIESRAVDLALSIVRATAQLPRALRSLQRAREYMHAHFRESLTLAQVARAADVHPVYLSQIFRQEFNETLGEYLNRIRVHAATESLANSELPLGDMALDLGFYDQSHFTRIFRQLTGVTPAVFRTEYTTRRRAFSGVQQNINSQNIDSQDKGRTDSMAAG
jgi:AraC family transcriptional regulator